MGSTSQADSGTKEADSRYRTLGDSAGRVDAVPICTSLGVEPQTKEVSEAAQPSNLDEGVVPIRTVDETRLEQVREERLRHVASAGRRFRLPRRSRGRVWVFVALAAAAVVCATAVLNLVGQGARDGRSTPASRTAGVGTSSPKSEVAPIGFPKTVTRRPAGIGAGRNPVGRRVAADPRSRRGKHPQTSKRAARASDDRKGKPPRRRARGNRRHAGKVKSRSAAGQAPALGGEEVNAPVAAATEEAPVVETPPPAETAPPPAEQAPPAAPPSHPEETSPQTSGESQAEQEFGFEH
jgi:hypothetical protein